MVDMVDVINKRCVSEGCKTVGSQKYSGYCCRCFVHLFPDKPIARNHKTKEFAVVDTIRKAFPEHSGSMSFDRIVTGGCSRRRPDIAWDLGWVW